MRLKAKSRPRAPVPQEAYSVSGDTQRTAASASTPKTERLESP
jgi:hypothetical protein